jgi:flavin reductase (DIM6/NTAB) family NADH-FMN oxidoreductase RutF
MIDVEEGMETKTTEIADGIYRLSTYVPHIAPPAGFTFNQFLVLGDWPASIAICVVCERHWHRALFCSSTLQSTHR